MFDSGVGIHTEIGACGFFGAVVSDVDKLISTSEKTGLTINSMSDGLVEKLIDSIMKRLVKTNLAKVIRGLDICVFELENNIDEISIALEEELKTSLNEFGNSLSFFSLERIRTLNNRVFLEQKKHI